MTENLLKLKLDLNVCKFVSKLNQYYIHVDVMLGLWYIYDLLQGKNGLLIYCKTLLKILIVK